MATIDTAATAEELMRQASGITGFTDFGPDGFQDGLRRTLAAFQDIPLTTTAREAAIGKLVADLASRLRIEQWYKDHPEVEAEEIEGPVLVCGLPRTGTTATVGMLATDPRYRFPRVWEMMNPVPPPVAGEEDRDPRAVAARKAAEEHAKHQSQHISDPDGPEEDLAILAPLNMHAYHGAYPMPDDYTAWWSDADFASTYAYHRRVLKLLQSRRGPRLWLLKAPVHLFKLEAFAAEYPNAKFIWTHRDPAKVIPSVSSLQYRLNEERCIEGALDKRDYGPRFTAFWTDGMRRALAARDRIGDDRFIDIWNDEVVKSPVETFERLYEKLGFAFTGECRRGIEDYSRRNARGAHGEHRYTAEEYGTSGEEIRAAFRDYVERFGL